MRELDELIDKLNNDKYAAVSVLDLDTNSFLFRNKTHAEIIEEYGTAEEFFETLFAKGHKRLNLNLKRKNGSTYKTDGQGFTVNFSADTLESQSQPQAQPKQVQIPDMFSNSFGLGTLDVMNLMVAKNDASRLFTENEVLKVENKEQKKLIEELKEERLAAKYSTDKSKGTQEMLMGAIQHLPTLISFAKGTPMPMTGLAAAVEDYSSPVKQSFAEALQNIDDTVVTVLGSINNGLNSNVEFSNELATLLKKYKLWQA
ncbi:hypothetical protein [Flavobacterium undicola]|uniref:hypothetical protein n=1 Tax=Flavobacterium undicola TaxID=1932779 RepID=UPI0013772EB9|nr:hypothetical protein [Flavobacterium undicola]MBA0884925.1 hypothetical protein [Flavobacterium undicola]